MRDDACKVCGSNKGFRQVSKLCGKHRQQMHKHGKIAKRTIQDGNEYIDVKTHIEMVLFDRQCKEKGRTLIDHRDKERVEEVGSWCMGTQGYPFNGRIKMTLHRFILGKRKGLEIDHINGSKLDNRRSNLRFVTHAVNTQSWVASYKMYLIKQFKAHLASGQDAESFFKQLLK